MSFVYGKPFEERKENVESHNQEQFIRYQCDLVTRLKPEKKIASDKRQNCHALCKQAALILSELWKREVETSDQALEGLLLILEHCLRFHTNELICFSEFIEGLGANLGPLIAEGYLPITRCDEKFQTNYAMTLVQQLTFIDITHDTNRLDAVFFGAPKLRDLITGEMVVEDLDSGSSGSTDSGDGAAGSRGKVEFLPEQEQAHLIAISNAPPISIQKEKTGDIKIKQGSGGLVTCCEPAMKSNPENIWLACLGPSIPVLVKPRRLNAVQGESEAPLPQALLVAGRVKQFCKDQYKLFPVSIPVNEYDIYYGGISNGILWPAFHNLAKYIAPEYGNLELLNSHWHAYLKVNFYFALDALHRSSSVDFLWVHDYHLIMLAMIIRLFNREIEAGFFLHIPFDPPNEFFVKYQPMATLLLKGMLRYTKVGFQTRRDAKQFMACVQHRFPGIVPTATGEQNVWKIEFERHTCSIGVFPVSVKNEEFLKYAYDAQIKERASHLRAQLMQGRQEGKLFFSAERFDYTKGIKEKLLAFERYLKKYPDRVACDRLVQVAVFNRTTVETYRKYQDECMEIAQRIGKMFKSEEECPLKMITSAMGREELIAHYLAMDVGVVTPLKDGMNLVAKEMLLCNPLTQLVLSVGAGVEAQFNEAGFYSDKGEKYYYRVTDITDADSFATVLRSTIDESEEAIAQRGQKLREFIVRNDIEKWRKDYLDPLWGDLKFESMNVQTLNDLYKVGHFVRKLRSQIVPDLLRGRGNKKRDWISMRNMLKSLTQSCPADTGKRIPIKLDNGRECVINVQNEIDQLEVDVKFSKILPKVGQKWNFVQFVKCLMENCQIDKQEFVAQVKRARQLIGKNAKFKIFISSFYGTLTRQTSTALMSQQAVYAALALSSFAKQCASYAVVITAAALTDPGVVNDYPVEKSEIDFGGLMGREWLFAGGVESYSCVPVVDSVAQAKLQALEAQIRSATNEAGFEIFNIISGGVRLHPHCLIVAQNDCYASVPMQLCNKWCSRVKEIVNEMDDSGKLFHVQDCSSHLVIFVKFDGDIKRFSKADGFKVYCQRKKITPYGKMLVCGDSMDDLPLLEHILKENAKDTTAIWVTTDICVRHAVSSIFEKCESKQFMFMSNPEVLLSALVEPLLSDESTVHIESPSQLGSETGQLLKSLPGK